MFLYTDDNAECLSVSFDTSSVGSLCEGDVVDVTLTNHGTMSAAFSRFKPLIIHSVIRRNVITNLKSFSDIRNDIRKVISETLTWEIRNISYFLAHKHNSKASFDIRKISFWNPILSDMSFGYIRKAFRVCYDASPKGTLKVCDQFQQHHRIIQHFPPPVPHVNRDFSIKE